MMDWTNRDADNLEWKGYVKRALESIDKKLVSIDSKMDCLDECVVKMKVKVATIGGTVSLVVTIIALLVRELIAK